MDDDDQFEMVWLNFEPWDELKLDTEYDIRLVPSHAGATEEIENEDQESPLTDNVVAKQTLIINSLCILCIFCLFTSQLLK